MSLYADASAKRLTQIVFDIAFVLWIVLAVWLGTTVHDKTMALAEPGRQTDKSATSLAKSMNDAGSVLVDVPLIGEGVSEPFDEAAGASEDIAGAGRSSVEAVERLAFWLGLAIAIIPIVVVATRYLPGRVRFVREATASRRLLDNRADLELFALRAMAHRPLHRLARITPDPVGAVRRQEWPVIHALASLELAEHGLKVPAPPQLPPPPGVPER